MRAVIFVRQRTPPWRWELDIRVQCRSGRCELITGETRAVFCDYRMAWLLMLYISFFLGVQRPRPGAVRLATILAAIPGRRGIQKKREEEKMELEQREKRVTGPP